VNDSRHIISRAFSFINTSGWFFKVQAKVFQPRSLSI
jgi:hypothetical protein